MGRKYICGWNVGSDVTGSSLMWTDAMCRREPPHHSPERQIRLWVGAGQRGRDAAWEPAAGYSLVHLASRGAGTSLTCCQHTNCLSQLCHGSRVMASGQGCLTSLSLILCLTLFSLNFLEP